NRIAQQVEVEPDASASTAALFSLSSFSLSSSSPATTTIWVQQQPPLLSVLVGNMSRAVACTITSASNDTMVECSLAAGGVGVGVPLFLVVLLGNFSVQSTDVISFPTAPVVTAVTGCDLSSSSAALNCPTEGGVPLLVVGDSFTPGLILFIGGVT